MMEIGEEVRENCHTKLLNAEFLNTMSRKSAQNSIKFRNENKQNIVDFGAEIPTATTRTQTTVTMQQINKTETVTAATTCTVGQEVKINKDDVPVVPELAITQINQLETVNKTRKSESNESVMENVEDSSQESLADPLDGSGETEGDFEQGEEEEEEEDEDDDEPDNTDDSSSDDSDFSDLSGMSEESGREWKPITKPINWVQKQIHSGANPRELLSQMLPNSGQIAPGLNDMTLWRILASMLSEPPRRQKLRYINTFADVIQLVREAKNIIVLTGAGVSVSCGIPDFRSSDGIYSRLAKDFPDLPDPQAMFDINYFSRDPRPFYKFAREIYPGQFTPSPCHRFIKLLESKQKLLRNYTQNIDTLEQVAGIKNVIECHGSFSTASCTKCKFKTTADAIRDDIFVQRIPVCLRCQPNVHQSVDASQPVSELELKQIVENGIMKPDIVFFGEGLPEKFHTVMASDKDKCDLLIVMGSSLKVRPVALIPSSIPAHVPQILINREQLHHLEFDVELLGDSDVIINQLCHHLGDEWKQICFDDKVLTESTELLPMFDEEDEENNTTTEEDTQQFRLDNDTQSVKSNASTDFALRSAGGYSDSGFESSTSSGVVVDKLANNVNSDTDSEATEAIQKIKSSILELSSETKTKKVVTELLSPDLLGDNMDTVDFENPTFHPTNLPDSYRHLSIDSSKDSGIQCYDSSNSATATNGAGALQPPLANFGNRNDTVIDSKISVESVSVPTTPTKKLNTAAPEIAEQQHKMTDLNGAECKIKMQQPQKNLSAADRLLDCTYYWHESSSSYVFPGAQVSWYTDSEEEDDDNFRDDDGGGGREDVGVDKTADSQDISPLLPPSIEAEMVTEITTTTETTASKPQCVGLVGATTSSTSFKRKSNESCDDEACIQIQSETSISLNNKKDLLQQTNITATTTLCSPPPMKKRRDSDIDNEKDVVRIQQHANNTATTEEILSTALLKNVGSDATTKITTTTAAAIESNKSTEVSTSQDVLLQQQQQQL